MGLQAAYSAANPPSASRRAPEAWTAENTPVTDGSERQLSDKDGFLKLFITQLQNQDPMNPMENTEMTAQLAQFSQLEQLANLNASFTTMVSAVLAQNQFQSLNLIGKEIKAEAYNLSLIGGEITTGADFQLLENAKVSVSIMDQNGHLVRYMELGQLEAGLHDLSWDGRSNSGDKAADGRYYFSITALNADGQEAEVYPSVRGRVTSVTFDETGQPYLHMDKAVVSLSQIMEILQQAQNGGGKAADEA